jgi:hypothetical protein
MFFSGGQLFLQQPSIFHLPVYYQQPCYVTYKFAVHDYLWYLDLGKFGHIYPTGVEALSSLEE